MRGEEKRNRHRHKHRNKGEESKREDELDRSVRKGERESERCLQCRRLQQLNANSLHRYGE